ncbi:sensor histidine kinase [Blastococcus xanthinilyticus]|uniref:histidine kinase n=1 Tax=Blastococcus xanthinilyticus TaxID=1564164 RepID=A0A5S5CRR7_9ACTN|nr:histidine kinase [Blastococcus xanthinilyticus]TYP86581.1 histidine kinase [Blastococcus xanthinilyticus]
MQRGTATPAIRRSLHRWIYLLLGGAIGLAVGVVLAWPVSVLWATGMPVVLLVLLAGLVLAAPVAAIGTLAEVRSIEGAAVAGLLTGRPQERPGPATTSAQRGRSAVLLVLHVATGALAGALLIIGVPTAAVVAAGPSELGGSLLPGLTPPEAPPARLALAAGIALLCLAGGELLGRAMAALAPRLLADPAAERLAAAEASVSLLAGRDRLARELHDSVGHALSLASVQAGAARRLLVRDPAAAEQAIRATEDAARRAMVDLDHVLGLLREDEGTPDDVAPAPDLRDLERLLADARGAGAQVSADVTGDLPGLPALVSREAYRIVQEGLTNVIRHAPRAACRLEVRAGDDELRLRLVNTVPGALPAEDRGGRGLVGVGERVRDLRGRLESGPGDDGCWRLQVQLPVHARGGAR